LAPMEPEHEDHATPESAGYADSAVGSSQALTNWATVRAELLAIRRLLAQPS